ncbi:MAG: lipid A deacylase LpxR family protein [Bacteroidetes bacterium]|nr:lipid A deacylase LpxR family protein [Bacteroidota bacterium]
MKQLLLLIFLFFQIAAHAQKMSYLSFKTENDFLNYRGKGTDRYYSAGIFVGLTLVNKENPRVIQNLSINQKLFTPDDISNLHLTNRDYPYTGLLYFTYSRSVIARNALSAVTYKVSSGSTGQNSGARQTQTAVHKWIHYRVPQGCDYELNMGQLLQFELNYNRALVTQNRIKISSFAGAEFGTIFNRLTIGTELKIGASNFNFNEGSFQVHPELFSKRSGFYFFARPELGYVLKNKMFSTDFGNTPVKEAEVTHKDMSRYVFSSSVGVSWYTPRLLVTLAQHSNTKEFVGADPHSYGEVQLVFRL